MLDIPKNNSISAIIKPSPGGRSGDLASLGPIKSVPKPTFTSYPSKVPRHFKLTNVPKIRSTVREDNESLINKTISWIRKQYKCSSIIREDIVSVNRACYLSGDTIEVTVGNTYILDGLRRIEKRDVRNRPTGIQLVLPT